MFKWFWTIFSLGAPVYCSLDSNNNGTWTEKALCKDTNGTEMNGIRCAYTVNIPYTVFWHWKSGLLVESLLTLLDFLAGESHNYIVLWVWGRVNRRDCSVWIFSITQNIVWPRWNNGLTIKHEMNVQLVKNLHNCNTLNYFFIYTQNSLKLLKADFSFLNLLMFHFHEQFFIPK